MKILFELRTALNGKGHNTNEGDIRAEQYYNGLSSFYELFRNIKSPNKINCKIILVDNTISSINQIPVRLLNLLDQNKETELILFEKNDYGKYNKGAGLIEAWREYDNIISQYDYFFHYEPRMILVDPSFIDYFLNKPGNIFSLENEEQVKTGYFGSRVNDIRSFYQSVNIAHMVNNSISIENMMLDYYNKIETEFVKNYHCCLWNYLSYDKNLWMKY